MSSGNQSSQMGEAGSSGVGDCVEGDDQDDPSSSSTSSELDEHGELNSFREQWQKELESQPPTTPMQSADEGPTVEARAQTLFLKGVENEQTGKLYEAIQFYRRAVQLVPDIEFRLYEATKQRQTAETENIRSEEVTVEAQTCNEESQEPTDLFPRLLKVINKSHCFCVSQYDQKGTHISSLPLEIMLYILRWVVSSDLDLRSLEMCSRVCRGLYICSRDQEIWRMACLRVWGLSCGGPSTEYSSWRDMFIHRPRLHFNGCYMSKTTYMRHGENSFQDQFYRPWHLVQYYRYLRFFPEGIVHMYTCSDEPAMTVTLLRGRTPRHPAVLVGHYRLHEDCVTIALQRQDSKHRAKLPRSHAAHPQTFHLELQICSYRSHIHKQLVWRGYSVYSRSLDSNTEFELVPGRFPPFCFSRVKSYSAEADHPLM